TKFLTMGFAVMVQAADGSWSAFKDNGTTGFYRKQSDGSYQADFSLDLWLNSNAMQIYDVEVQVIGAILDIYTAGAGTALADIMVAMVKEAKPILQALSSGDSRGLVTSLADVAGTLVAAAPSALALMKDAAPGTYAFVSTVGDDISKAWNATNKAFAGAVDSIADVDTFGPEMAVQASRLASTFGGSIAARGAALAAGNPIADIGGTIDTAYVEKARAATGVGGFWFDHGWNLDLTAIKLIDTRVAGFQEKIDETVRQAVRDQLAGAPEFAKTFVAHGAVVSVAQATQQGLLVPDPQIRIPGQVVTEYAAGYVPPELAGQQTALAVAGAKGGALASNAARARTPSAAITVPGKRAAVGALKVLAGLSAVGLAGWGGYKLLERPRENPSRKLVAGVAIGAGVLGLLALLASSSKAAAPPPPAKPTASGGFAANLGAQVRSSLVNPNAPYQGAGTGPSTTDLGTLMNITHALTVGEVQYLLRLWAGIVRVPSSTWAAATLDPTTRATIAAMRSDGVWDDSVTLAVRAFQLKGMGYQGANVVQGDPFDSQTSAALHSVARSFANVGF
ncbi:MAG: hypothetical protein ACHQQR_00810, partial [Gemmatimonadales bacterium]